MIWQATFGNGVGGGMTTELLECCLGAWGSFASCLRVAGRAKGDVYGRGPVVEGGGFRCVLGLEKGEREEGQNTILRHGFL